jgi:hypothetical protein
MTAFKSTINWARAHSVWLALVALPILIAACTNSGSGGNGY